MKAIFHTRCRPADVLFKEALAEMVFRSLRPTLILGAMTHRPWDASADGRWT